jgi:hypothetical protein
MCYKGVTLPGLAAQCSKGWIARGPHSPTNSPPVLYPGGCERSTKYAGSSVGEGGGGRGAGERRLVSGEDNIVSPLTSRRVCCPRSTHLSSSRSSASTTPVVILLLYYCYTVLTLLIHCLLDCLSHCCHTVVTLYLFVFRCVCYIQEELIYFPDNRTVQRHLFAE